MSEAAPQLTPLDGTFLELEDDDPAAHMHIGALLVFGPRPGAGPPTLQTLREHLDDRLDALPAYRRRLAGPGTGGLTWQRWVPDEDFAIHRHVHGAPLREPGGWEELLEWAGDFYAQRLDRRRPLWEVVLVTGLADGHWALATKTHHCLVDGVGSVDAAALLLDDVGEALVAAAPPAPAEPSHRLPAVPGWLSPRGLARTAGGALHAATHPVELAQRAAAVAELLVRQELHGAPATSLNGRIGPRRAERAVGIELEEARLVRRARGGTVNDVVLAGVCSGLRALLLERGEPLPAQGLRAMVPVNIRHDDEHGDTLGNHVTSLFIDLPVAEPNPIVRYERISEVTAATKASTQPGATDALLKVTGVAPPVVHHLLARSLYGKRLFNLTVTNVPGPPVALSALGAPLKAVWPLVPLAADHAVGVAIVSYDGRLMFGINADPDAVPDVDVLARGIADGLRELQRLGHAAGEALSA